MRFWIGLRSNKMVCEVIHKVSSFSQRAFIFLLVWIVSNEQLLAWVRNPVPISQLDTVSALKCFVPQVDASQKICNGIPQNEAGILSHCQFSDFPFYTCVCIFAGPHSAVLIRCIWLLVRLPQTATLTEQPQPRTASVRWSSASLS